MALITHNTSVTITQEPKPRRIQAYAFQYGRGQAEIRLDLNGEPVSLLDLSPDDARNVIAILRASLADLKEDA